MPSSFKGIDLFGSGPQRFRVLRRGQLVIAKISQDVFEPGSVPLGLMELDVVVEGRLVAASESLLWARRDAITAQLLDVPTGGVLIDLFGRTWTEMSLHRYEEAEEGVMRGRMWSVGYAASFRRFDGD